MKWKDSNKMKSISKIAKKFRADGQYNRAAAVEFLLDDNMYLVTCAALGLDVTKGYKITEVAKKLIKLTKDTDV